MANFSKTDLISAFRAELVTPISKSAAEEITDVIFQIIKQQAETGDTVNIPGFGRFAVKERAAREGRNPRTGDTVQIAAKRTLAFRPSKSST